MSVQQNKTCKKKCKGRDLKIKPTALVSRTQTFEKLEALPCKKNQANIEGVDKWPFDKELGMNTRKPGRIIKTQPESWRRHLGDLWCCSSLHRSRTLGEQNDFRVQARCFHPWLNSDSVPCISGNHFLAVSGKSPFAYLTTSIEETSSKPRQFACMQVYYLWSHDGLLLDLEGGWGQPQELGMGLNREGSITHNLH